MSAEHLREVEAIFHRACSLPRDERRGFLALECSDNATLRSAVERLLDRDEQTDDLCAPVTVRAHLEHLADAAEDVGGAGDEAASRLPRRVGQYRIVRRIAVGGMSVVYEAEQETPRRCVALKMIRTGSLSPSLLRRFRQESELLGRLQHPGIAKIFEAGTHDDGNGAQPFFAMELIEGQNLLEHAAAYKQGTAERLALFAEVCEAVHHAHQKGVIHRDLKPTNVLVEPDVLTHGRPKVLDFGVARVTGSDLQLTTVKTDIGQLIGTVPYMSPEQVAGDAAGLDSRSDIYALGVLLYELLAGRLPYELEGRSIPDAVRVIRDAQPVPLRLVDSRFRGDVDTIVMKAIEKDPARRYQSAFGLAADIQRHLRREPIAAHPPSTFYQLRKFATRNRTLFTVASTALVMLALATVMSIRQSSLAREHAAATERVAASVEDERRIALREAARANVAAAHGALEYGDIAGATRFLTAVTHDYRGWEWRHLRSRMIQHTATFTASSPPVGPALFAPDGAHVTAALSDGTVAVWSVETGRRVHTLAAGADLTTVAIDVEYARLAGGCVDGRVIVWDLATGARQEELTVGAEPVAALAWDAGGTRLAVAAGRALHLWDGDSMTVLGAAVRQRPFVRLAISPCGTRLAALESPEASSSTRVLIVSLDTGERLAAAASSSVMISIAYAPDGKRLAVGTVHQQIEVRDAETLALREQWSSDFNGATGVAYAPDGARLASISDDRTIRIWDVASGTVTRVLPRGPGTGGSIAFSPDGARLLSGTSSVKLWDPAAEASTPLRGHDDYVYTVAFSRDGSLIASATFDNTDVRLWDPLERESIARQPAPAAARFGLAFDASGTRLLGLGAPLPGWSHLSAWACDTGRRAEIPDAADSWRRMLAVVGTNRGGLRLGPNEQFSPDGALCAFAAEGADRVDLLDAATGEPVAALPHDGAVWGVAFDPVRDRLATAGADGRVEIWDVAGRVRIDGFAAHSSDVYCVAYTPDGTRLVTGGKDMTVRIWDADSHVALLVLRGHEQYVKAIAFSPDGARLVSASGDRTLRIWDTIPVAVREDERRRALARREAMRPFVRGLLEKLGDPTRVATRIEADAGLDEADRRAARRVLLEWGQIYFPQGE